jgi:ATP synthase F1 gamma subunit
MTMGLLKEIVSSVSIPVVAIGGINAENILQLCGSGVDGVAVVSAIFAAEDPGKSTADLLKLAEETADEEHGDFLLEPDPKTLLKSILPLYFANLLTQMVLEGKASEQSARMVAMKSATENAKTLIGELTLEYNKARQAQITNELLEITTAMKAME